LWYFYGTMPVDSVPNAKTQASSEYSRRIDRVIDYLRENLHRPVKLGELAHVACFSEFHFHRIFGAVSGETLNNFTNRLRLEKAARLLRYSDKPDRYSFRLRFFVIGRVFTCLPIRLRHFAKSVSKKRRDQKEQDLQRTLPGRGIWSPYERGRKESRFSSEIDRHSRKASRLYSGYECLRTGQSTCRPQDSDRMGQIPGYFFARNSFRNDGRRSTT